MQVLSAALLIVFLSIPVSAAAAAPRPTTKATLIDAAMTAISKSDVGAYVALFPRVDELGEHCPDLMSDPKMAQAVLAMPTMAEPQVRKKMKACHALIDFSKAERIRAEGGDRKSEPEKGCKDFYELEDILVYLKVGERSFRVKLDDPFVMGDGLYGVSDDPRCTEE